MKFVSALKFTPDASKILAIYDDNNFNTPWTMHIFSSYDGAVYSTYYEKSTTMIGAINPDGVLLDNSLNIYASFTMKDSTSVLKWSLVKFLADQTNNINMIYARTYYDTKCSYGSSGSNLAYI